MRTGSRVHEALVEMLDAFLSTRLALMRDTQECDCSPVGGTYGRSAALVLSARLESVAARLTMFRE